MDIRSCVLILLRRRLVIAAFFLLTAITLTIAAFLQKEVYRATATVVLDTDGMGMATTKGILAPQEPYGYYLQTQKEIMRSRRTAHHVIKNLKLDRSEGFAGEDDLIGSLLKKLRVKPIRGAKILKITVDDQDPRLASLIANEFARVYVDSSIGLKIKAYKQAQSWLREEIDKQRRRVRESEFKLQVFKEKNNILSIKKEIGAAYLDNLERGSESVQEAGEKKKKALALEKKAIKYSSLQRDIEINERILQATLNRLKEAPASEEIFANSARVQDLAEVPKRPIKPRMALSIALSVIFGLVGATALAFFMDYADAVLEEPYEAAGLLEAPLLGSVPNIRPDNKNVRKKEDIYRVVEKDSYSLASEAYRTIRTNLLFSMGRSKCIFITSIAPKEGRTITAVNLSLMMANSGEGVLLVDADMRKPRVHRIFGETNEPGLYQYLLEENDFNSIVRDSGIHNLHIVTAGKGMRKSTGLLSSKNMESFLEQANARFSRIIFDAPQLSLIADTQMLSGIVTGVIMILGGPSLTRNLVARTKRLLQKSNANLLGVIVNNMLLARQVYKS